MGIVLKVFGAIAIGMAITIIVRGAFSAQAIGVGLLYAPIGILFFVIGSNYLRLKRIEKILQKEDQPNSAGGENGTEGKK